VVALRYSGGEITHLPSHRGKAMQDPVYGLPGMHLLGTSVNRDAKGYYEPLHLTLSITTFCASGACSPNSIVVTVNPSRLASKLTSSSLRASRRCRAGRLPPGEDPLDFRKISAHRQGVVLGPEILRILETTAGYVHHRLFATLH
jgi:hypothetical protein